MATRYVRSTDGSNADNGTTWALAKADLVGVSAIDTAGDNIYVSQAHAESTAGAITFAGAGTNASPTNLVCGNDAAEPPTAVAASATVTTTGSNSITINGSLYAYGISFISGLACLLATTAGDKQRYENCNFHYNGSGGQIGPPGTANVTTFVQFINCGFKQLGSTSRFYLGGRVEIIGGSILSGSTALSGNGFVALGTGDRCGVDLFVSGFDFSNQSASGLVLVSLAAGTDPAKAIFRNCKLPASWSGTLITGTISPGNRIEMHNCDAGNTNYRLEVQDYAGSIKSETTIIRTGGASDGTTGLSWKMVSSANASYPAETLSSPEIVIWNDTTGSSKTVTVEIIHSGVGAGTAGAFQNNEIWLEVEYLGDGSFPESTLITNCKADFLATAADQASSSTTWTSSPATPVKQKLAVTFTPQNKGFIHARVVLAKASKTVYVDPALTVS